MFLAKRTTLVYSWSTKICALGFDELLESIFCLLWLWNHFPCEKLSKMLKEMVVDWQEVRRIWRMKQNFVAQFDQVLKHQLCNVQSGVVMEKNRAYSVEQCGLLALQFSVLLINLLSILLRWSGFTRIQKALVDQMGSRPPNSYIVPMTFLMQVWLWKVLWSFFLI